ncbi:MAG: DUF4434 domain-containing protein [Firmicutes bacterium]|nr:DUF4434 domain-containing protein [Bacillota bacterium]
MSIKYAPIWRLILFAALAATWPMCISVEKTKAAGETRSHFSGTFLQLDAGNAIWSEAQWDEEFASMKRLGMNILIVQWAATPEQVYYPAKDLPGRRYVPSPLDIVMQKAEKYGFLVYLGPYMNEAWWSCYMDASFVEQELAITARVAGELYSLYGRSPAFAGWYLPYEINASAVSAPAARHYAARLLRQAVDLLHGITPNKPVTISPFFDRQLSIDMFESWWKEALTGSGITTVFLQDGVGTQRGISPEIAAQYFAAMRRATAAAGIRLWGDLEIFVESTWTSAPWERVKSQMVAEAPHVEGFVIFEYNHYMSPVRGGAAKELYDIYFRYLQDMAVSQ